MGQGSLFICPYADWDQPVCPDRNVPKRHRDGVVTIYKYNHKGSSQLNKKGGFSNLFDPRVTENGQYVPKICSFKKNHTFLKVKKRGVDPPPLHGNHNFFTFFQLTWSLNNRALCSMNSTHIFVMFYVYFITYQIY